MLLYGVFGWLDVSGEDPFVLVCVGLNRHLFEWADWPFPLYFDRCDRDVLFLDWVRVFKLLCLLSSSCWI